MIQNQTLLQVQDNSGAKKVKCIKILKGSFTSTTKIGGLIILTVQQLRKKVKQSKTKIQTGDIFIGLITQTKSKIHRLDGHNICFDQNTVVLLNKQYKLLSSRVLGPVSRNVRSDQFLKIGLLASGII